MENNSLATAGEKKLIAVASVLNLIYCINGSRQAEGVPAQNFQDL